MKNAKQARALLQLEIVPKIVNPRAPSSRPKKGRSPQRRSSNGSNGRAAFAVAFGGGVDILLAAARGRLDIHVVLCASPHDLRGRAIPIAR